MGLCWDENTKYWGKDGFPYKESAPMAAQLWHTMTEAKVILQVVYTASSPPQSLLEYKLHMAKVAPGSIVRLVEAEDGLGCPLQAQLIRLVAFSLPEVSPDDIVVTADVDAFITSPKVTLPLTVLNTRKMWIYRYLKSKYEGVTFMLPFLGARAGVWRDILDYPGSLKGMVDNYKKVIKLKETYTWEYDQDISTRSILKSGVCSLPKDNPLWERLNLTPNPVNDSATCWHAPVGWEDCNNRLWYRNTLMRYYGGGSCKWWHFYPDERLPALKAKFKEILSNFRSGGDEGGVSGSILHRIRGVHKMVGKAWKENKRLLQGE